MWDFIWRTWCCWLFPGLADLTSIQSESLKEANLVLATLLGHELPFVQTSKDYPSISRRKRGGIWRIWSISQCFVVVKTLCQEDFSHLLLDSCTGKYLGARTEHAVTHCWQPRRGAPPRTAPLICWKLRPGHVQNRLRYLDLLLAGSVECGAP